jgi:hypothetical protein
MIRVTQRIIHKQSVPTSTSFKVESHSETVKRTVVWFMFIPVFVKNTVISFSN